MRNDPFPFQAVRDLLGIARALYAAEKERGAGHEHLRRIERVGKELSASLDLAQRCDVGTLGHAAAWNRAERATQALGDLVDCLMPLLPMVEAAVGRIGSRSRAQRRRRSER